VRRIAYEIAARGHVVCNLNYSLAPEHPFPAAVEDAVYAARWLTRHGNDFGGDTSAGIAVAGDSAGATLAAATMIAIFGENDGIDEGDLAGVDVDFSAAVLLYGVLDYPLLVTEPGSNAGIIEMAGNLAYLGPNFLRRHRHPLVSPVFAGSLNRFPPCYISCGDEDSLLGQSLSMAKALTAANVPTTLSVISGADHSFPLAQEPTPEARSEMRRLVDWLSLHTNVRGA
jgi:acetyl esterase